MEFNKLSEIFRSPDVQRAIDKLIELATRFGLSLTSVDFLRDALFGYVESYLDGATCSNPECFTRLGHAKDIPDFTYCNACGKKVGVIKITPLRMYLAIANNADLFEILPDKIKANPEKLNLVKRFGNTVLKFYDAITIDMIMEPLLAWMKDKRPDLYYTLAFYPTLPKYVQLLYELEMDRLEREELISLARELGLEANPNPKELKDVIIEGLELALDRRSEYYILSGKEFVKRVDTEEEAIEWIEKNRGKYPSLSYIKNIGASGYALKTFSWQVETLKAKMRQILVDVLTS